MPYEAEKSIIMLDGGVDGFIPDYDKPLQHIYLQDDGTQWLYILNSNVDESTELFFYMVSLKCRSWFRNCS